MDKDKVQRIQETENFLNQLYGKIPAGNFVYLGTTQQGRLIFGDSFNVEDTANMAKRAIERADSGVDVWHCVNPVAIEPHDGKRGKADVVSYQTAIVTDIDFISPAHKEENLAADFDEAKSFLPFTPSIIINSGYGLQAYFIFDEPILITDQNRELLTQRNNLLLDAIRIRANGKKIDGVGDLPRILRTPNTFNYKLGRDNAPMCRIVEDFGLRFAPADIDQKLDALIAENPTANSPRTAKNTDTVISIETHNRTRSNSLNRPTEQERATAMLDKIPCSALSYEDWIQVGMILKSNGNDLSDWEQWSRADERRFTQGEHDTKWRGFSDHGALSIASLHALAKLFGYSERDFLRDWYQLHPDARPSANHRNIEDETKKELDAAIIWLDTLEPDNFSANDAHNPDTLRAVAIAMTFGFTEDAEKFFTTIKKAKDAAQIRLKDAETELTAPLSEQEELALNALVEGVNLKSLRSAVAREVTEIKRALEKFHARQAKQREHTEAVKRAQKRQQQVSDNMQQLIELRAEYKKNPSPELAAQIQDLILHTCEHSIDKYTGAVNVVKATQKNANLIFTFDPYLDGLFGYDEFQQADVFLKAPPWNKRIQKGDEWTDRDDAQLQTYIRDTYTEFASESLILKNITCYSDSHSFHEIRDFFKNLPKWDGVKRAETLFIKFLRAKDNAYTRELTLNWLTAAVARIFHPGCDYQTVPILLGNQGIGKSHVLSRLGGKWYGALTDDVDDPHAIDAIKRLWIVEVKELAPMRRDVRANKSFFDASSDVRRFAYERRAKKILRQNVFCGTTNDRECLADQTGNRRFPIFECLSATQDFVEGLTDDYVKQVWAEVFAHCKELFKDGFDESKLRLSRAAQIQANAIAEEHLADDGMTTEIKGYVDTPILPQTLWLLLTREERRDFIKNGRLVMPDALTEFNHRRRARGGNPDTVQRDVDAITSHLKPSQQKPWLRIENKKIFGNPVDEYTLYGSEPRQHICATEIFNECFGTDKRKSMKRINEILSQLDGWTLGERIQKSDPAYPDQKKPYYRN